MLRVKWTRPALSDLIEAQSYIAQEDPQAAELVGQRIWDASQGLGENPKMGRIGHVKNTREWVVQKTPYLIVYQIQSNRLDILHVYHGKQNWQSISEEK